MLLCLCVCLCGTRIQCLQRADKSTRSTEEVTDSCVSLCGCWESDLCPPEKKAVKTLKCPAISRPDTSALRFKWMQIQLNFKLKSHLLLAIVQALHSHTIDSLDPKGTFHRSLLELARCLADRERSIVFVGSIKWSSWDPVRLNDTLGNSTILKCSDIN